MNQNSRLVLVLTGQYEIADNSVMVRKSLIVLCLVLAFLLTPSSVFFSEGGSVLASPDNLKWSKVSTPTQEGNVVLSPSEINVFVIGPDDETFYAIDIPGDPVGGKYPNGKVYKSTDAGLTWGDKPTEKLAGKGANLPAWDIAVAPDDSEIVAVVTDDRTKVYVSEDGGENWYDAHIPDLGTMLIGSIAISTEYGSGDRDIAIGTRNPIIITNGDVWIIEMGGIGGKKAQALNMDVSAVDFSPAYDVDKTILAIGSDNTGTYLCTGIRNTQENLTYWDVTSPEKVEISMTSGASPQKDGIITSNLALPGDYSGGNAIKRVVYVAYSSDTDADDVYRIEDTEVRRLDVKHGKKIAIVSIAYYGDCNTGEIMVGEAAAEEKYAKALVYMCSNPEECFPRWRRPIGFKSPTGGVFSQRANAQVAWSHNGKLAYCGTSTNWVESAADWVNNAKWEGQALDESAFSRSRDKGDTWNQLSLIDTAMDKISDFALSSDYKTLYLASIGNGFDSVWRSEGEIGEETWKGKWERILCPDHEGDIILRSTPEESTGDAIFFAIVDTSDTRYSLDNGQVWEEVWNCPDVTDLAVANDKLFYILDDDLVHKAWWDDESWNGIWEWQSNVDTNLRHGYSIEVSGEDFVFVGDEGDEGKVAYSTDGGVAFKLTETVPEPGKLHIAPDEEFSSNRLIYIASNEGKIYRWTIGGSTSWRELNPPQSKFCGIAQTSGALYGAYSSGVDRTLIPHMETIKMSDWDNLRVGLASGVDFKSGSLRAVSTEDKKVHLWAVDDNKYFKGDISKYDDSGYNTVGRLWIYSDTFVLQMPWPISPAIGEFVTCDICTCEAEGFCFRWLQIPLAEEYDLWIALDDEFSAILYKEENTRPADCCNPAWCPSPNIFRFVCGETYYWKVRASSSIEGERIHSRWSPPIYFTVKICSSVELMHVTPILDVPQSGSNDMSRSPTFSWTGFSDTTIYEFVLAEDAELTQVVVREQLPTPAYQYADNLDWGRTYFWQVRAIEPVISEPAVATFTVMSRPAVASVTPATSVTAFWIWLVIGILASLIIAIVVFCLITKR